MLILHKRSESSVLFYGFVVVGGNITVPEKCITIRVHFATIDFVCTSRSPVKYTRILYGTCLNVPWTYPYLHLKNWIWSICVCTQIHKVVFSAQREDLSHNQESRCIYTDTDRIYEEVLSIRFLVLVDPIHSSYTVSRNSSSKLYRLIL